MALLVPQFMPTPAGMSDIEIGVADLRTSYAALQPGVYGQGDLAVTVAAGIAVNVAAGIGYVQAAAADERYRVQNTASVLSTAFDGGGLAAPSSSNPRLDQIIARVYDHSVDGSNRREWVLQKVTGTPTAGATRDNRFGAAALPARSYLLADALVPPNAPALVADNIRDRRQTLRGHLVRAAVPGEAMAGVACFEGRPSLGVQVYSSAPAGLISSIARLQLGIYDLGLNAVSPGVRWLGVVSPYYDASSGWVQWLGQTSLRIGLRTSAGLAVDDAFTVMFMG